MIIQSRAMYGLDVVDSSNPLNVALIKSVLDYQVTL